MTILKFISRTIIKKSFNLSVLTIEKFNDMTPCDQQVDELRKLPEGTLGRDIAKCLDDNKLRLVPKYESHDLKHVLLDFKMTPVDEIRMQAFMLGNGNYTIPCFAILTFGAILLPGKWTTLYADFKLGRTTKPISTWTIDEFAEKETTQLRKIVFEHSHNRQTIFTMKTITKYGAIASITAGIFGMIFCLPFLFSSSLADLVGAGFPFVGGAILAVGGLLALSNLSRPQSKPTYA
jgi:hypothetical protein